MKTVFFLYMGLLFGTVCMSFHELNRSFGGSFYDIMIEVLHEQAGRF